MKARHVPLLVLVFAVPASSALALDSHTYADVTPAVFACVKETSQTRQGTIYSEAGSDRGTATTASSLWTVVMDYVFSPESGDLQYWLRRKTWIVPTGAVWNGIADMIAECRAQQQ